MRPEGMNFEYPEYEEVRKKIERATLGGRNGVELASMAAKAVDTGELRGPLKEWLIKSLREISEGKDPKKALGITGRRGRNLEMEEAKKRRDIGIYAMLKFYKKRKYPDITKNAAILCLMDYLGLDVKELDLPTLRAISKDSETSDVMLRKVWSNATDAKTLDRAYKRVSDLLQEDVYSGQ